MAKQSWFDRLWGLTHPATDSATTPNEGLVLSGGGSRASFQIGALRYLYDHCQIAPTSVTSTSAGSMVAAMLAQSLDPAQQYANLRTLEDYWMAMTGPESMFAEQAWFKKLREQWGDIAEVLPEPETGDPAVITDTDDAEHVVKEALEFDPSTEENDFSLSMLWQIVGSLARIGKVGAGLASAVRGAERAASAYRPGPIVYQLLFESGFSTQAVHDSGMNLRVAFVGLHSGKLRFMRQDGVIVDTNDQPIADTAYDLSLGIWASCAIPGVFRPMKLGDELYVDGGVRENIPVEMAVSSLGVTKPYVIVSTAPDVANTDFEPKDLVSVMMRSFNILLDETIRDELDWARRAGATVINPLISVHGAMQIEPGLLRINRDYGWMRAAEEMTGAGSGVSGGVIETRLALYHAQTNPLSDHNPSPKKVIASLRASLRSAIANCDPALLPPGYESWSDETWS